MPAKPRPPGSGREPRGQGGPQMGQSCDLSAAGLIRRWETCLEVYRSEENSITLNLNVERQSLFCNNIHGLCMLGNDKEPCFTHSQSDMVSIAGFPIL